MLDGFLWMYYLIIVSFLTVLRSLICVSLISLGHILGIYLRVETVLMLLNVTAVTSPLNPRRRLAVYNDRLERLKGEIQFFAH